MAMTIFFTHVQKAGVPIKYNGCYPPTQAPLQIIRKMMVKNAIDQLIRSL
jgi:hypothetical protein